MINLDELTEISGILQQGLSKDETYEAVFKILERTINFESATLFIHNKKTDQLEIVLNHGEYTVDLADNISFLRGKGLSSWMSQQKQPVVLQSLAKARPGRMNMFKSFLSLPLWVGDKLIGVLNLGHNEPNIYVKEEIDEYISITAQISVVVDKLTLKAQLDEQNKRLKEALDELQKTQDKLVENERFAAIGEIIVTINHKINNSLTPLIGYAELLPLMIETRNIRKAKQSALKILDAAREIKKITRQLANISTTSNEDYLKDLKMIALPEADISEKSSAAID